MRIVALFLALLAFWFAYDSASIGSGHSDDDDAHEDRAAAARAAVDAAVPGATPLGTVDEIFGERTRRGPQVRYAFRLVRRFDWRGVAFADDAQGGVMATILEQAETQRRHLEPAGFQAVRARGSGSRALVGEPPLPGTPSRPRVSVRVAHRDEGPGSRGQGQGGYEVDLDDPQIVHHRIYVHPSSGATVFTRIEFDRQARRTVVELTYADRTLIGADYGAHTYVLNEWIDQVD